MRTFAFFFLLVLSVTVSGQQLTDTIFWNGGTPKQVNHFSLVKSNKISRAQMFQRGIHEGDPITQLRMLDSTRLFAESGEHLQTKTRSYRKKPLSAAEISTRKNMTAPKRRDMLMYSPKLVSFEGRAGMLIRRTLHLPPGKALKDLRRPDEYPDIELLQTPADTNGTFTVKIRIPAGAITHKLLFNTDEEVPLVRPISLRGYHLNETDFKRRDQLTEAQTWRAEGQQLLYLRLRSTEKLMHIYQDGERYTQVPVGRQLDEIRIGALPTGKYLLEIIDLGTQEKRYHWIVTGK